MKNSTSDVERERAFLTFQRNEISEHFIYKKLSRLTRDKHNREILKKISEDELHHYNIWKLYTKRDVKPNRYKIWFYFLISKIFGLTFGIKLLEENEEEAQQIYEKIRELVPEAKIIIKDADNHEKQLIEMIDEDRLNYIGSIVLGLNDALVELTGTLAGLTLALQNTRLIGLAGLIVGIAASLSMAASEYLSTKSEGGTRSSTRASLYTGIAYVLTVLVLVFPYLIFNNYYLSLGLTIINAVLVIFFFTFYISVVKHLSFKIRFLEMLVIGFGVASLSFAIGFLMRLLLNVDV
jgi:VIT1/CCC1 family predicted Fe2+/Mn2+ transporter